MTSKNLLIVPINTDLTEKTLATSTANTTYASQCQELISAYDALTDEQKRKTYIVNTSHNIVFHFQMDWNAGIYTSVYRADNQAETTWTFYLKSKIYAENGVAKSSTTNGGQLLLCMRP